MKAIEIGIFDEIVKDFKKEYKEYIDDANTNAMINKLIKLLKSKSKLIKS